MRNFVQAFLHDLYDQFRVVANVKQYIEEHEFRLTVKAILVGVVVWGLTVSLRTLAHDLLHRSLHLPEQFESNWFILFPLLAGGLLVALLSRLTGRQILYTDDEGHVHNLVDIEGDGVERTLALYNSTQPSLAHVLHKRATVENRWTFPSLSLALRKFLATLCTIGSGGSGGLEGSVVLIGEGLAAGLFKTRGWDEQLGRIPARLIGWWRPDSAVELRTLQLCGVAAAVSTLVGAPFMAAFFATEVIYRRGAILRKFVYTLIAAVTAHLMGAMVGLQSRVIHLEQLTFPPQTWQFYLTVAGVGVVVSLVALLFTGLHYAFDRMFGRIDNIWLRFGTGATATGLIAILASALTGHDLTLVLGPGEDLISEVLNQNVLIPIALVGLVGKLVATSTTISSGGSAGLLIPALFFGAMVANIFAQLTGQPVAPLVAVAMAAGLVALVHIPLSSLIFVIEAFSASYLLPALVAMIISSLIAYDTSIYRTQQTLAQGEELAPGYGIERVPVPPAFANRTIRDLAIQQTYEVNIIGLIHHDGGGYIGPTIVPKPDMVLHKDDELVIVGPTDNINKIWALSEVEETA